MHDSVTFKDLLANLAKTPDRIRQLISEVTPEAATYKPSDQEFSILENVCHLRDIEIEGYSNRIRRILNEENPELPDIDGSRLAIERNYNRQDLAQSAEAFAEARERNLMLVKDAQSQQLSRVGNLEGVGNISLGRLLEMMIEHDDGHVEELRSLQRLTKLQSQNSNFI